MEGPRLSTLPLILEDIRLLDAPKLNELFETIPLPGIPIEYLSGLCEQDQLTARHACPLAWFELVPMLSALLRVNSTTSKGATLSVINISRSHSDLSSISKSCHCLARLFYTQSVGYGH